MISLPILGLQSVVVLLYFLTVVGVIITVILENRNPLKTSAWVLIIGLVPIVGLIAYILFGQEQRKLYRINKRYYQRLQKSPRMQAVLPQQVHNSTIPRHYQNLIQLVEHNSDSPLMSYDSCDIYTQGREFYDQLLSDIQRATTHIHIESYLFEPDNIFERLSQALISKRAQGVDIRIIYDYLGSYNIEERQWQKLKAYGIQIYPFLPVRIPLLSSTVNYRNHRKICIIDGEIGYIGGMNFASRYQDGNELGCWRDTHFRLTGEAVSALQSDFLMDWYTVSKRVVHVERFFHPNPTGYKESNALIQFIFGGPLEEYPNIEQALTSIIYQAKKHIRIQTPYLLPTESLYNALISASLSGVKVEIMIPNKGDSLVTSLAMDSYLSTLLQAGVFIHRYQGGFLHSKILIADNELACLGSANLDFRSLEHNFEVMGIAYDPRLAQQLSKIYDEDCKSCHTLDDDSWARRPLSRRFGESVMRLFAPLL
ncbi:MAG: cardiolipin synthase [Porphyromonas sp.]|nr:cardiolipin synthase [Porphyromonas sp.]